MSLAAFLFGSYLPLVPPPAARWHCLSDKTERGGESVGSVEDFPGGVRFSGSLGSIPGRDGKPVGFALARIPFRATEDGIEVWLRSDRDLTVLILVAPPVREPATTYQRALRLRTGRLKRYRIRWRSFFPTVRGRPDPTAPSLDPNAVTSFAVEVTRGSQPGRERYSPIEFKIEILETGPPRR